MMQTVPIPIVPRDDTEVVFSPVPAMATVANVGSTFFVLVYVVNSCGVTLLCCVFFCFVLLVVLRFNKSTAN